MSSVVDKQEIIDMIRMKSPRLELVSFDAGKSEAWRWFKRVRVDGHVLPYAVCNGCFKPVHYTPRDGTGGLRRHACALTVAMSQAKEKEANKANKGAQGAGSPGGHSRSSSSSAVDRPSLLSTVADKKKVGHRQADALLSPVSAYSHRNSLPGSLLHADRGLDTAAESSNGGQSRSRSSSNRRSGAPSSSAASSSPSVPISLTLWAAEKGLVDLANANTAAGLPQGLPAGLSIASAFAALQGIQSMAPNALSRSPFTHLQSLANPFAVNAHQQQQQQLSPAAVPASPPPSSTNGHHPLDLALDLAMKKSNNNNGNATKSVDTHPAEQPQQHDRYPLQQVQTDNEHKQLDRERAQSIVDHILKNINQHSSKFSLNDTSKSALTLALDNELSDKKLTHDSNQNIDQNVQHQSSNRFSIVPQCRSGRRPRKRSHPDRAIPTSSINQQQQPLDEDIEANLQMLAQVANEPAVKRERMSPDTVDNSSFNHQEESSRLQRSLAPYKMNGGQMTPNSQRSLPSPDAHDEICSSKSERSSPAQFVPVADHEVTPFRLRDTSQLEKVESFVQSLNKVLEATPECSLATGAQSLQLGDLQMCLNSLLDLHKKYLKVFESKMPVPELQKPAPLFKGLAVVDGQFKEISLEDYKGKYVILFFYPLDFTFVCPTEIIAFSERADEFRKIGCELVACSTDSHFCHLAWVNTPRKQGGLGSLNIPLLADKSTTIAKAYGVYKEDEGLTFRGLFIIDDQQRLRQITINDLPVGRSVDETLRLVQAFQFTDKHGEVCPAGWTPGKKTMKADPAGSKEYFEASN